MSSTTRTIDQLRLSPYNVRTNEEDANNTASMERSLLLRGQMMPLLVHPMRGARRSAVDGVFAGGRRYRSFVKLIEAGKLPRDHPIDVVVRELSEAELTELSLAENNERKNLRDYEKFAAVVKAHKRGATIEHIAETVGEPPIEIQRWIRLGSLAKPIFEALEHKRISVDQAKAFAATEDHDAQIAAWDALRGTADSIGVYSAARIRAELGVGDAEMERLLAFVGADAYRTAGGDFEMDLFAEIEAHRGRVTNKALLRQLADAALALLREDARRRAGRDVRFVVQAPRNDYGTDQTLEIHPKAGDGDALILPDGDVVATLIIDAAGAALVQWWWASKKAKFGTPKAARAAAPPRPERAVGSAIDDRASPGATRQANDEIRDEVGLTESTIQIFRSLRRSIMRAMFVRDARRHGTAAIDYLVWSQLRLLIGMDRASQVGMRPIGAVDVDTEAAREEIHASEASQEWRFALYEMQAQTFLTGTDLEGAFLDYRCSPPSQKNLAAAIVAGLAIERSLNFGTYRLPVHDAVVADIGADDAVIRSLWRPTEALIERIPAAHRLAIAEPYVERVTLGAWQRLKSAELTTHIVELVTGRATGVRASMADAAARWVHPLLQFGTPAGAAEAADLEIREAAE